jgi:hypothetical protein
MIYHAGGGSKKGKTMKKQTKNILACAIGNTLEWFDYTLYL